MAESCPPSIQHMRLFCTGFEATPLPAMDGAANRQSAPSRIRVLLTFRFQARYINVCRLTIPAIEPWNGSTPIVTPGASTRAVGGSSHGRKHPSRDKSEYERG